MFDDVSIEACGLDDLVQLEFFFLTNGTSFFKWKQEISNVASVHAFPNGWGVIIAFLLTGS